MNKSILKAGYWSAMSAFIATVAYCIVQLLQVAGTLTFPWDERLIYGTSLGIVIPFVLALLALHYRTPSEKRFWSHGALLFSLLYAVFVSANYVVQLATVSHPQHGGVDVDALPHPHLKYPYPFFSEPSAAGRCYAPADPSEDPLLHTSTILPVTPPFPSNSCACLASARGNCCAMSGLILCC
jgi:hypothetical protein